MHLKFFIRCKVNLDSFILYEHPSFTTIILTKNFLSLINCLALLKTHCHFKYVSKCRIHILIHSSIFLLLCQYCIPSISANFQLDLILGKCKFSIFFSPRLFLASQILTIPCTVQTQLLNIYISNCLLEFQCAFDETMCHFG